MTDTGFGNKDAQERIILLRQTFSGAGWETQRILDELDNTSDLYCEDLVQVLAPRYSSGRVVMLGDAAYCASPNSGMGTTLSLSGAHILASELALSPHDHQTAFRRYEEKMRPIATKAQDIPMRILRLMQPESRWGLAILRGTLAMLGATIWAVMRVPWPKLVVDKVREMGESKTLAPVYEELQRY
jgi:2-polyprenyl-6-methoxyphenol hydroxylase-like FAD-dependent oxidoreductase